MSKIVNPLGEITLPPIEIAYAEDRRSRATKTGMKTVRHFSMKALASPFLNVLLLAARFGFSLQRARVGYGKAD
jgi:hypothetical protein